MVLAYGVEPARRRYRLRLARYDALGETAAEYARMRGATKERPLALLDAGLGSGRSFAYIAHHGAGDLYRFTGVDVKDPRRRLMFGADRWRLVRADAEAGLPFADAAFDLVVCEQMIEHTHAPERVLAELARVLRSGGLMLLGAPTFAPGARWVREHAVPILDRLTGASARGHHQFYSASTLRRAVERTGAFRVREARGFRVMAGGPLYPLENYDRWRRLNRWIGGRAPWLCTEVQILAERT